MTTIFLGAFAERERERLEEKKQREQSEKTTSKASQAEEVAEEKVQESTTLPAANPAINEVEPAKELKIEVHATAVHHEQIQPVVAHAQAHEISHEHAVSIGFLNFHKVEISET